jgi:anti-sigma factor RsiW
MEPDILELLSGYRDGELSPREREKVERALAADPSLRARLEDMEAVSTRMHELLQMRASGADLPGFSDRVMQRLGPRRAPLLERLRVAIAELLEFRPLQLAGAAVATAAVLVVAAVALQGGTAGPQLVPGTDIGTPAGPLVGQRGTSAMEREAPGVELLSLEPADGHDTMVLSSRDNLMILVQ